VEVTVYGGGKRDLDRVCTAVLDALQGGGAMRDDCLVDALTARRFAAPPGQSPVTRVEVAAVARWRRVGGRQRGATRPQSVSTGRRYDGNSA
jgi:hypothetical protein